jgi:hypothetical protein
MTNELMISFLSKMVYESGCLLQIEYLVHILFPNQPEAIIFTFENDIFTVKAIAEDDTIEIANGIPNFEQSYEIIQAPENDLLLKARHKKLRWAWLLTNHQGYNDGLRFEFANSFSEEKITVELITVASSLEIYQSSETQIS